MAFAKDSAYNPGEIYDKGDPFGSYTRMQKRFFKKSCSHRRFEIHAWVPVEGDELDLLTRQTEIRKVNHRREQATNSRIRNRLWQDIRRMDELADKFMRALSIETDDSIYELHGYTFDPSTGVFYREPMEYAELTKLGIPVNGDLNDLMALAKKLGVTVH